MADDNQFVSRVGGYPVVASTVSQVRGLYTRAKESSNLVKYSLETAESGVKSLTESSVIPAVTQTLEKPLSAVNQMACSQLDRLEQTYPMVNHPTEEGNDHSLFGNISSYGKNLVKDLSTSGLSKVTDISSGGINLVKDMSTNGLSKVTDISSSGINLVKDISTGGLSKVTDISSGINLAKDLTTNGINLAKDLTTGGLSKVTDISSGGINLAKDLTTGGLSKVTDISSGGINLVKDLTTGGLSKVTDISSGGINLVKDLTTGGLSKVTDISSGINLAKDLTTNGINLAKDLTTGGLSKVTDISSGGINLVKDLTGGLSKATDISSGINLAKDLTTNGINLAKDLTTGGLSKVTDISSGGINLAKDLTTNGINLAKDLTTGGLSKVTDISTGGINLVKDLTTGGLSKVGDISASGINLVKDLSTNSLNKVKDISAYGISKVHDISSFGLDKVGAITSLGLHGLGDLTSLGLHGLTDFNLHLMLKVIRVAATETAETLLETPPARMVTGSVDHALTYVEGCIDKYLPEAEHPAHDPSIPASQRLYDRALRKIRTLHIRSKETLEKLSLTLNLIDYAKANLEAVNDKLAKSVSAVQQKGQYYWDEIRKENDNETEEEKKQKSAIEAQLINVSRQLCKQLRNGLHSINDVIIPHHLVDQVIEAKQKSSDLVRQVMKASRLDDISEALLSQARTHVSYIQSTVHHLGEYVAEVTGLKLVGTSAGDEVEMDDISVKV